MCLFENTRFPMPDNDHVFIKPGITRHSNVMDRFNPKVYDGYSKVYDDWRITCKFSQSCVSKEVAERLERYWLQDQLPAAKYKVWVEDYLGLTNKNYYYNNTGITELRLVTKREATEIYKQLYNRHKL